MRAVKAARAWLQLYNCNMNPVNATWSNATRHLDSKGRKSMSVFPYLDVFEWRNARNDCFPCNVCQQQLKMCSDSVSILHWKCAFHVNDHNARAQHVTPTVYSKDPVSRAKRPVSAVSPLPQTLTAETRELNLTPGPLNHSMPSSSVLCQLAAISLVWFGLVWEKKEPLPRCRSVPWVFFFDQT